MFMYLQTVFFIFYRASTQLLTENRTKSKNIDVCTKVIVVYTSKSWLCGSLVVIVPKSYFNKTYFCLYSSLSLPTQSSSFHPRNRAVESSFYFIVLILALKYKSRAVNTVIMESEPIEPSLIAMDSCFTAFDKDWWVLSTIFKKNFHFLLISCWTSAKLLSWILCVFFFEGICVLRDTFGEELKIINICLEQ